MSGFSNGQLLTTLNATVHGMVRSQLLFDYEEVPDPLIRDDVNVSVHVCACVCVCVCVCVCEVRYTVWCSAGPDS